MHQLATVDQTLFAFQRTLEEYDAADALPQVFGQPDMIFCLSGPQRFKLMLIILTIKNQVFQTLIGIITDEPPQVLPHGLAVEIKLLAAVSDPAEIAVGPADFFRDLHQGSCHPPCRQTITDSRSPPFIHNASPFLDIYGIRHNAGLVHQAHGAPAVGMPQGGVQFLSHPCLMVCLLLPPYPVELFRQVGTIKCGNNRIPLLHPCQDPLARCLPARVQLLRNIHSVDERPLLVAVRLPVALVTPFPVDLKQDPGKLGQCDLFTGGLGPQPQRFERGARPLLGQNGRFVDPSCFFHHSGQFVASKLETVGVPAQAAL